MSVSVSKRRFSFFQLYLRVIFAHTKRSVGYFSDDSSRSQQQNIHKFEIDIFEIVLFCIIVQRHRHSNFEQQSYSGNTKSGVKFCTHLKMKKKKKKKKNKKEKKKKINKKKKKKRLP